MREYEIEKSVSLASLRSEALLALQENGACQFEVPEALFDVDHPGHYFRRIRSVAITIPAVSGPYSGVSFTLSLLSSRIRVNPRPTPAYAWQSPNDDRFAEQTRAPITIVSTLSGEGEFQRHMPFEGAGAISAWRIELSQPASQFDLKAIKDVILHMRYTSRQGGERLKRLAILDVRQCRSRP